MDKNENILVLCRHYITDEGEIYCMSNFDCVSTFNIFRKFKEGVVNIDWITYLARKEHFDEIQILRDYDK